MLRVLLLLLLLLLLCHVFTSSQNHICLAVFPKKISPKKNFPKRNFPNKIFPKKNFPKFFFLKFFFPVLHNKIQKNFIYQQIGKSVEHWGFLNWSPTVNFTFWWKTWAAIEICVFEWYTKQNPKLWSANALLFLTKYIQKPSWLSRVQENSSNVWLILKCWTIDDVKSTNPKTKSQTNIISTEFE